MSQIGDGGHERREQYRIHQRPDVAGRQEVGQHDDHLEQEDGDAQDGAKLDPNRNPAEPCASSLHPPSHLVGLICPADMRHSTYAENERSKYEAVSYTHLRAHETDSYLVCRLLLEKKKKKEKNKKKKKKKK